mmetsp:Transcript_11564/g.36734  ORF Transcript_11564/g.36734 Transcript_11564/m.36734 type:complete len:81 (-) Transcript_11564:1077-1319(-)
MYMYMNRCAPVHLLLVLLGDVVGLCCCGCPVVSCDAVGVFASAQRFYSSFPSDTQPARRLFLLAKISMYRPLGTKSSTRE